MPHKPYSGNFIDYKAKVALVRDAVRRYLANPCYTLPATAQMPAISRQGPGLMPVDIQADEMDLSCTTLICEIIAPYWTDPDRLDIGGQALALDAFPTRAQKPIDCLRSLRDALPSTLQDH